MLLTSQTTVVKQKPYKVGNKHNWSEVEQVLLISRRGESFFPETRSVNGCDDSERVSDIVYFLCIYRLFLFIKVLLVVIVG